MDFEKKNKKKIPMIKFFAILVSNHMPVMSQLPLPVIRSDLVTGPSISCDLHKLTIIWLGLLWGFSQWLVRQVGRWQLGMGYGPLLYCYRCLPFLLLALLMKVLGCGIPSSCVKTPKASIHVPNWMRACLRGCPLTSHPDLPLLFTSELCLH